MGLTMDVKEIYYRTYDNAKTDAIARSKEKKEFDSAEEKHYQLVVEPLLTILE